MSPSALLTVCTKSRSLPVKTFTAKEFHLHHPAQKPDHGARQGRGQGRARQAWAVPESGHKLPQLSDAKRVETGPLGCHLPQCGSNGGREGHGSGAVSGPGQGDTEEPSFGRCRHPEGATLTRPCSRRGWRSQRTPASPGEGFACVSSRLHFLTCQTKGFQVPSAPTRLCGLLGLGQPD